MDLFPGVLAPLEILLEKRADKTLSMVAEIILLIIAGNKLSVQNLHIQKAH